MCAVVSFPSFPPNLVLKFWPWYSISNQSFLSRQVQRYRFLAKYAVKSADWVWCCPLKNNVRNKTWWVRGVSCHVHVTLGGEDIYWACQYFVVCTTSRKWNKTKKNKTRLSLPSPLGFFALLFTAKLLYYLGFYLYKPERTWTPLGKFSICAPMLRLHWSSGVWLRQTSCYPWFEMAMGKSNFLKRANCFLLSSHGEQLVGL